ncbi:MAG: protein-L-isoaspartate O-methyltransferase [Alphaproteobacteria bacterium]|nr:protein-L-isoaspartate O-methyltransferase [Alphaproteobacteria bacterium]
MPDFALARRNMIDGQLRPNKVTDPEVLRAMALIPREAFVPAARQAVAYADDDVPLGNGRFLMEPMVLARLIQALQVRADTNALVAMAGPGYGAAVLSHLVGSVVVLEEDAVLAASGAAALASLGAGNCTPAQAGAGTGFPSGAPYGAILVEAGIGTIPKALLDQLADGGRLAAVVAPANGGMGVATLAVKSGGVCATRPLFDAGTPAAPAGRAAAGFVF